MNLSNAFRTFALAHLFLYAGLPLCAQETAAEVPAPGAEEAAAEEETGTPYTVTALPSYGTSTSLPEKKYASAWQYETSYIGVPLFVAGALITLEQEDYRAMRNSFIPHFNSTLDNYSQYSPLALTAALKLCGVKTRSSWPKFTVSSAFSAAIMAALVNSIKYSVREMRPDNSTRNSFPSGHTATSFMSATIMSKELGGRSPWYSVGAYTVASATGLFRILNNRHWVNDVVFGAGIGITSVDLGYFISDLIFKEKKYPVGFYGQNGRLSLSERPSFLSIGMSMGYMNNIKAPDIYDDYLADMTAAPGANPLNLKLKTGATTSLCAEGAYFLNKNIGVGGRLRAVACPITVDCSSDFKPYVFQDEGSSVQLFNLQNIESASMGLINVDLGPYFSIPLTNRMNLGGKLLIGDCITTDFDLNAYVTVADFLKPYVDEESFNDPEFMCIETSHALNLGLGLNLTYAIKPNAAVRFHVDYNHAAPKYTYNFYNRLEIDETQEIPISFIEDSFTQRVRLNEISAGISIISTF